MKEAAELNKQMDALVAFRVKVENPTASFDCSVEMTRLASDVSASATALHASTPRGVQLNRKLFHPHLAFFLSFFLSFFYYPIHMNQRLLLLV